MMCSITVDRKRKYASCNVTTIEIILGKHTHRWVKTPSNSTKLFSRLQG